MVDQIVGSKMSSLPTGAYSAERGAQGQNGAQPSSIGMGGNVDFSGQNGVRKLKGALDISPPGGDDALDQVMGRGSRLPDSSPALDPQTRGTGKTPSESAAPYPITHGHHNPDGSPSGKVGAGLTDSKSEPIRQPSYTTSKAK